MIVHGRDRGARDLLVEPQAEGEQIAADARVTVELQAAPEREGAAAGGEAALFVLRGRAGRVRGDLVGDAVGPATILGAPAAVAQAVVVAVAADEVGRRAAAPPLGLKAGLPARARAVVEVAVGAQRAVRRPLAVQIATF